MEQSLTLLYENLGYKLWETVELQFKREDDEMWDVALLLPLLAAYLGRLALMNLYLSTFKD